jgi:hypothetical protein
MAFVVVLVPEEQVEADPDRPGFVYLTGTPGQGAWEQWGPYASIGEMTIPAEITQARGSAGVPQPHEPEAVLRAV